MGNWKLNVFGKTLLELRSGESTSNFSLKDLGDDGLEILLGGGRKSNSGQIVNQKTAIGFSGVVSGVRVIAETIASLSFNVHRRTSNSNQEIDYSHTLQYLIHTAPFHLYTSFIFRETLISHSLYWGNGYAHIIRNSLNGILGFKILHPRTVTPYLDDDGFLWYKVYGIENPISSLDMIHIQGFVQDGIVGLALTDVAKESIGTGLSMQEFAAKFFANGANLKGALQTEQVLKEDTYKRIKESWQQNHEGKGNEWKTPILEGGLKYQPISFTPEQSQLLEARKFQLIEVARVLRIPPHKLADLSKSTNNNIEHQSIEFVTDTIRPWAKRIEGEFNRKIFKQREQSKRFVRLNMNSLLRGDVKARGEFYTKMFSCGAYSPNDILRHEGENTYDGGDQRYVQGAYIPVDIIKDKYKADFLKELQKQKKNEND